MTVEMKKIYRLEEFELDPNKRRLTGADGKPVHLAHKPFQVLLYFIVNRDRIVSRQELLDQFWEGREVYDITLTKCVGAIRKALGENTETPRFIETRWAEGYRYIGSIEEVPAYAAIGVQASEAKLTAETVENETSAPQLDHGDAQANLKKETIVADRSAQPLARSGGIASWSFPAALSGGWKLKALVASGIAVVSFLLFWALFLRVKPQRTIAGPDWSKAKSTRLTNKAGAEYSVNLAPDGKMFIYADRSSGNWDIYWQRIGGRNTVNLTKDSTADDQQPAYSPDGNHIAFRSERKTPGVYVMEATSENVRRVSDFGYYPAWSPDGKELVASTGSFIDPTERGRVPSELWVFNVATGAKRLLTNGDAIQPSWSPGGQRIAYWGMPTGSGQRDIWTIPASGGEAVQVTNDPALDWNPVWSSDGKYLYFASDRGGSMNFWRVLIDETTGHLQRAPEAVITPSAYSQHLSFSRDGNSLAYAQKSETTNLQRVGFDPFNEKLIGEPEEITQGSQYVSSPDLSPDESWFAFSSQGEKQEDIMLVKRDGTERRQLTNDLYRDRGPRWSPDGQRIAFYSDRGGRFEIWSINFDGTDLRQLTQTVGPSTVFPMWSPDGQHMLYKQRDSQPFLFAVNRSWSDQTPEKLPSIKDVGDNFWATSWSADGRKLAGTWIHNLNHYVHVYDFQTQTYENLELLGRGPVWFADNRRLLFYRDGRLYVVDTQTKKLRELISVDPYEISPVCVTRDTTTIFFTVQKTESDIWVLTRE